MKYEFLMENLLKILRSCGTNNREFLQHLRMIIMDLVAKVT